MKTQTFAARLRTLRERAGMTQQGLEARAGVSQATVSRLEAGKFAPGWATVQALAAALRVGIEAFNGKGERL